MTSKYDPSRDTVGKIYRDAQINNKEEFVFVGDLAHELATSLAEDLNTTILSNPFQGRPFFITIHESKDLQMQKAIRRRMITTLYRPYPEDDTVVFYTDPGKNETLFCWCLPHWSEMDNMLMNPQLWEPEMIRQIKAWKALDLHEFGFRKDPMGNWIPNEHYKDKPLEKPKRILSI